MGRLTRPGLDEYRPRRRAGVPSCLTPDRSAALSKTVPQGPASTAADGNRRLTKAAQPLNKRHDSDVRTSIKRRRISCRHCGIIATSQCDFVNDVKHGPDG